MESRSVHRYARISASKVRPVAELVRGLSVDSAQAVLKASPRRGARFLEKVIKAAAAHILDQNQAASVQDMIVDKVWIDGGPLMKRFRPRAFGRTAKILKRTCHISVVLTTKE